jgi:hypothetical protein
MLSLHVPIYLHPGEQTSVSFALAAAWWDEGKLLDVGKPLFLSPGAYSIKCLYRIDVKRETDLSKTINVIVTKPQGVDHDVCQVLKKDASLASALLSPVHIPDKVLVPKLKALV